MNFNEKYFDVSNLLKVHACFWHALYLEYVSLELGHTIHTWLAADVPGVKTANQNSMEAVMSLMMSSAGGYTAHMLDRFSPLWHITSHYCTKHDAYMHSVGYHYMCDTHITLVTWGMVLCYNIVSQHKTSLVMDKNLFNIT